MFSVFGDDINGVDVIKHVTHSKETIVNDNLYKNGVAAYYQSQTHSPKLMRMISLI
jgi:hypothetical protein